MWGQSSVVEQLALGLAPVPHEHMHTHSFAHQHSHATCGFFSLISILICFLNIFMKEAEDSGGLFLLRNPIFHCFVRIGHTFPPSRDPALLFTPSHLTALSSDGLGQRLRHHRMNGHLWVIMKQCHLQMCAILLMCDAFSNSTQTMKIELDNALIK